MILWTIQPEEVYKNIMESGFYHCDYNKSGMKHCQLQYDWLVSQMIKRIGKRPSGVEYPVWAWFQWTEKRKKPDLRNERWGNGWKGERFVLMEIEIPDKDVLLSDFDAWSIILVNGLLSNTEEEDRLLELKYSSLSEIEQKKMKSQNWEGVFDLSKVNNEWMRKGESIQATFWELRKEQILDVRMFTAASPKPEYLQDR